MNKGGWKLLAISLIILFIAILFFGLYVIGVGYESMRNEEECKRLCLVNEDCFSYTFNISNNYCFQHNIYGDDIEMFDLNK